MLPSRERRILTGEDAPPSTPRAPALFRALRVVRHLEVLLFSGAPLLGVAFAGGLRTGNVPDVVTFLVANGLLFAHIFAFNDWGNVAKDLQDPRRSGRTFVRHGLSPGSMLALTLALGTGALALLLWLSLSCFLLGVVMVVLSALYSHPRLDHRSWPIMSSLNHFTGGVVQFLLGYAVVRPVDSAAVLMGIYFAIVLIAGHLVQELRDLDGDRLTGVSTNAVRFGRRRTFLISSFLFALSYAYLASLAHIQVAPAAWLSFGWVAPLHFWFSWRTWRTPLRTPDLQRYQIVYRSVFVVIGAAMLLDLVWHPRSLLVAA